MKVRQTETIRSIMNHDVLKFYNARGEDGKETHVLIFIGPGILMSKER